MCNCGKNGIKIENQKVLTHDSEWGWELVEDAIFCPFCGENLQPERSKREDDYGKFRKISDEQWDVTTKLLFHD